MAVHEAVPGMGPLRIEAVAESFFAILEYDLLAERGFPRRQAAPRADFKFIEVWYDRARRHASLSDVSPAQYEQRLQAAQTRCLPNRVRSSHRSDAVAEDGDDAHLLRVHRRHGVWHDAAIHQQRGAGS